MPGIEGDDIDFSAQRGHVDAEEEEETTPAEADVDLKWTMPKARRLGDTFVRDLENILSEEKEKMMLTNRLILRRMDKTSIVHQAPFMIAPIICNTHPGYGRGRFPTISRMP